jgi:hypothetical protein
MAAGHSTPDVATLLDVPVGTLARWRHSLPTDQRLPPECFVCTSQVPPPRVGSSYAYLLGQYLGDGHLATSARVPVLRIYSCADYPRMGLEISAAIEAVRGRTPGTVRGSNSDRLLTIQSYWKHWPCLLPQHGPGRKHERPIVLADWQQSIVDEHPWPLIRGLIHSDGCRATNRVVVRGRTYTYPRYFFTNESRDIHAILAAAFDRVGVAWRMNRANSISVARRDAVEMLDEHVGPKR